MADLDCGFRFWGMRLKTLTAVVLCSLAGCQRGPVTGDAGVSNDVNAPSVRDSGADVDASVDAGLDAGTLPAATAAVDSSLKPKMSGTAERPTAAVVGQAGAQLDFVSNEFVIITDDSAALDAFLSRHQGTVISTTRFAELGLTDLPAIHHVKVQTLDPFDAATFARDVARTGSTRTDALRVSDDAALRVLATAMHETKPGFVVNANSIVVPQGIVDGESYEAFEGDLGDWAKQYPGRYEPNAFNWPYMTAEQGLNVGVGDAWRFLAAADRLKPTVRLLIIDGGFRQHDDLPANTVMLSRWNVPNAASCGGNPCPWHGTGVASAAASIINNGVGTAGTGGPVVKLYLGQIWGEINDVGDVFARLFETLKSLVTISGALGTLEPLIISLSGATNLPAILDPAISAVWGVLSTGFRAKNVMLLAAAGNAGENLDRETCFTVFCWEPAVTVPCELGNVFCIGGTKSSELTRHPQSSWGSADSVDLFAPFLVWTVDEDAVQNGRAMRAKLTGGTSVSTPFVAGIAALVWAANPTLSVTEVETTLTQTANISPDPQVRRVVNAAAAVRRTLGPGQPRIYAWPQTTVKHPINEPFEVALNNPGKFYTPSVGVRAYPSAPGPMTLTLSSDREDVSDHVLHFSSLGLRTITATVTDSTGASDARSFVVDVGLPESRLFAVLGADHNWADQLLYADGRGLERLGNGFVDVPCERIRWVVPFVKTPIGNRAVGSVVTEIDTDAVVFGQPRASARGCHAQFSLSEGQHTLTATLLAADLTTVQGEPRTLQANVDPKVDAESPRLGALSVEHGPGQISVNPTELDFYVTGVFKTAHALRVQYSDPGTQSIEGLRYSATSLVNGNRVELPIDPSNSDDALLPAQDTSLTPWPGTWLAVEPEPSMIVLRASVTDEGLTATRPYLLRLKRHTIIK